LLLSVSAQTTGGDAAAATPGVVAGVTPGVVPGFTPGDTGANTAAPTPAPSPTTTPKPTPSPAKLYNASVDAANAALSDFEKAVKRVVDRQNDEKASDAAGEKALAAAGDRSPEHEAYVAEEQEKDQMRDLKKAVIERLLAMDKLASADPEATHADLPAARHRLSIGQYYRAKYDSHYAARQRMSPRSYEMDCHARDLYDDADDAIRHFYRRVREDIRKSFRQAKRDRKKEELEKELPQVLKVYNEQAKAREIAAKEAAAAKAQAEAEKAAAEAAAAKVEAAQRAEAARLAAQEAQAKAAAEKAAEQAANKKAEQAANNAADAKQKADEVKAAASTTKEAVAPNTRGAAVALASRSAPVSTSTNALLVACMASVALVVGLRVSLRRTAPQIGEFPALG